MSNYPQQNQKRGNNFQNPHSNKKKETKTFDELAKEVKDSIFRDNFDEILQMSKTPQLDNLLYSIEIFAGRSQVENPTKKQLGATVTTSQLRNVYDKVLKTKHVNDLKMIRPQLAYIAGREKGVEVQKFLAFLDFLIKSIHNNEQVKEFKVFFEAVVAYHKFYGKKNNQN
ncbi:MAG: type III-A CRISPR-associated protein Csm2 [Prevotellaceae bacterium]|jgi:CRISPR-associated protein Csm2|nr:type III-A CRISPR-associated protein Csm2 [Prevotellaceae bacterium]